MPELEKFLVNFVVEQTGYPPEVVELDADLEADLGIDSIKKAQMFGELQEYFDIARGEPERRRQLDARRLSHVAAYRELPGGLAAEDPGANRRAACGRSRAADTGSSKLPRRRRLHRSALPQRPPVWNWPSWKSS